MLAKLTPGHLSIKKKLFSKSFQFKAQIQQNVLVASCNSHAYTNSPSLSSSSSILLALSLSLAQWIAKDIGSTFWKKTWTFFVKHFPGEPFRTFWPFNHQDIFQFIEKKGECPKHRRMKNFLWPSKFNWKIGRNLNINQSLISKCVFYNLTHWYDLHNTLEA